MYTLCGIKALPILDISYIIGSAICSAGYVLGTQPFLKQYVGLCNLCSGLVEGLQRWKIFHKEKTNGGGSHRKSESFFTLAY